MVWGGLQGCRNDCYLLTGSVESWGPVTYMVGAASDIPQQGELQYGLNLISFVQHCLFSIA